MRCIWFVVLSMMFVLIVGHTESHAEVEAIQKYNYNIDRDQIVEKFHKLSKSGGLIESPKLPEEYYYNASIYTQKGDLINARKAYESLFKFNITFVDTIQKYIDILKTQEKDANIVNILKRINNNRSNPAIELYIALQNSDQFKKIEALKKLTKKHNKFAPIHYFIANDLAMNFPSRSINNSKPSDVESLSKFNNYIMKTISSEYKRVVALFDQGYGYKFYFDKIVARAVYDESKNMPGRYDKAIESSAVAEKQLAESKKTMLAQVMQGWVSGLTATAIQGGATPEEIKMATSAYIEWMQASGLNNKEINEIKKEALSNENILKAKSEQNKQLKQMEREQNKHYKQMGLTVDQIDRLNNPNKPYQHFAGDNGVVASVTVNKLAQALELFEKNKFDEVKKMKKDGSLVIIPKGTQIKLISPKWEYKLRELPEVPLVRIEYNATELWTTPDQITSK